MADRFNFSDVFISYSRKDNEFAKKLTDHLERDRHEVWVDWQEIPESAQWWSEITAGIEATNVFVFIISPDSVHSEICHKEIQHAIDNNKRFVPILYRAVDLDSYGENLHPAISSHNWLFFTEASDFEATYSKLKDTLKRDLNHTRSHTRLLVRAKEWEEHQHSTSYLLIGDDARNAEIWLLASEGKTPVPTQHQREYIQASIKHGIHLREEALAQQERELALQKRATSRLRILVAGLIISLIVFGGLFGLTLHTQRQLDSERASNAFEQGSNFLMNAQYGEARVAFDTYVELRPDDAQGHLFLAQALLRSLEYDEASVRADDAIRLDPENGEAYFIRGQIKLAQDSFTEAIEDFSRVIDFDPENIDAYYQRGLVYRHLLIQLTNQDDDEMNYQQALADFSRVIELDAEHVDAYVQLGNLENSRHRYEEAITYFDSAINIAPDRASAYGGRSIALLNMESVDEASADFNRFVSLQPDTHFQSLPVDLEQTIAFSYFGNTRIAVEWGQRWGYDSVYQGLHGGIDFHIGRGEDVSVQAGVEGIYVRTRSFAQTLTVYIQVDEYLVLYQGLEDVPEFTVGELITPETFLGKIVSSSFNPHLHLETRYQNENMLVNPLYFIPPILIGDILASFPNFEEQFYVDDTWNQWRDPFNQPVLIAGGPVIGPRAE